MHKKCFQFLPGITVVPKKNNAYANFWPKFIMANVF